MYIKQSICFQVGSHIRSKMYSIDGCELFSFANSDTWWYRAVTHFVVLQFCTSCCLVERMPRVRSVYAPRFGSQLSSSERSEHGPDQFVSSTPSETDKRGKNRREKAERPLLKVKLPKLKSSSLSPKVIKDVRTPTKWTLKPSSSKTKLTINQEKQTECNVTFNLL